ncbi:MAG: hypothetical protein Q8P02_05315 [Candidatus Micrarchaeota archaeon]|nr:hypothetical protein [Candidatus Micrarchaeota archaeon]
MPVRIVHRKEFADLLPVDAHLLSSMRNDARNFFGYVETQGAWLPTTLDLIRQRIKQPGRGLIRVMDLGPGNGAHFADAPKSPRLRHYAFGPNKPSQAPDFVTHLPHWIEETVMPDSADLMQSRWGAVHHAANRSIALENALNSLRTGGQLVLHSRELSDLPYELRDYAKNRKSELRDDLLSCIARYRSASASDAQRMEDNDGFYLSHRVLTELGRQGFNVPSDAEFADAYAHGRDLIIRKNRSRADLKAFYASLNRSFVKIPVY